MLTLFCCFLIFSWSLTALAESELIGDQLDVGPEVAALADDHAVSAQSGNVIRTVYNAGGASLSDVLGISRASVLSVLRSHLNDN